MLCSKLFKDMVSDPDHKLAYLLPKKLESFKKLRKNRTFEVPKCKTDRYKNSFIVTYTRKYNDI